MGRLQDMHVMGGGCGDAVHMTAHQLSAYSTVCSTRWHPALLQPHALLLCTGPYLLGLQRGEGRCGCVCCCQGGRLLALGQRLGQGLGGRGGEGWRRGRREKITLVWVWIARCHNIHASVVQQHPGHLVTAAEVCTCWCWCCWCCCRCCWAAASCTPTRLTHRHLAPQVCDGCLLLAQPGRQPCHLPRQPRGSRQLAIHALLQPPHLGQPPLVTGSTPGTRHTAHVSKALPKTQKHLGR